MGINLSGLNERNKGGGGPRRVNITVELVGFELKDPKKANPAEDIMVARLLCPVTIPGFPAYTEDADGNPTTEIRVKVPPREVKGDNKPIEIFDIGRGKNLLKPSKAGALIELERATFDSRSGIVEAGWLKVRTHGPLSENALEMGHVGHLVSVSKEYYEDVDGERKYRQTRTLVLNNDARVFNSMDEFYQAAGEFLVDQPDSGGGRPGVFVRIIEIDKPTQDIAMTTISRGWNSEESRPATPEESVQSFMNSPRQANWVDNLKLAGTKDAEGYLLEMIPHYTWSTGGASLPKGRERFDDSRDFQIPVEGSDKTFSGFAEGDMFLMRKEDGPFVATGTTRRSRFLPIFPREEIVTPNLPKEVADLYRERAAQRGRDAGAALSGNKQQPKADSADEDIGFAEPDHGSRGVTPK